MFNSCKEGEKVYKEGYEIKGRIEIPKTKVDYPIFADNTKRTLEMGITIAYGPGLNEPGNTCLYGHNYRNSLFFSNNDKLTNRKLTYRAQHITNIWDIAPIGLFMQYSQKILIFVSGLSKKNHFL